MPSAVVCLSSCTLPRLSYLLLAVSSCCCWSFLPTRTLGSPYAEPKVVLFAYKSNFFSTESRSPTKVRMSGSRKSDFFFCIGRVYHLATTRFWYKHMNFSVLISTLIVSKPAQLRKILPDTILNFQYDFLEFHMFLNQVGLPLFHHSSISISNFFWNSKNPKFQILFG